MHSSIGSIQTACDVDDATWELATNRSALLRPLAEAERSNALEVRYVAQRLGLSVQHTYRLIKKLREEKTTSALIPHARGPRLGSRRLSDAVERLIMEVVKKSYLQREKPTLTRVYRHLCEACRAVDRKPPSMKALRARINAIDLKKQVRRREGPAVAEAHFHQIKGSLETTRPLEIVQIDHTKVDRGDVVDGPRTKCARMKSSPSTTHGATYGNDFDDWPRPGQECFSGAWDR